MLYEHASSSFAWKAGATPLAVELDSDLSRAYEEVRSGKGLAIIRGLPLDGTLEKFIDAVCEAGRHFGHALSQNAQGELVGVLSLNDLARNVKRDGRDSLSPEPIASTLAAICAPRSQGARSDGSPSPSAR